VSSTTEEKMRAPKLDAIEVLLTLSPGQYAEMGQDIEALRRGLELPKSASSTQVILEAVHRQAGAG
jgi:hypothetical protein